MPAGIPYLVLTLEASRAKHQREQGLQPGLLSGQTP